MDLDTMFPAHKAGLHLDHNDHKNAYESAEHWIVENGETYDWKDDEAKQRAIDTDEIWTLQWYPNTPVGFCAVAAPTLAEVLELANPGSAACTPQPADGKADQP